MCLKLFTLPVPKSKEDGTHLQESQLMQFWEIIAVYSEKYMERINGLRKQTAIGYGKETNPQDTLTYLCSFVSFLTISNFSLFTKSVFFFPYKSQCKQLLFPKNVSTDFLAMGAVLSL